MSSIQRWERRTTFTLIFLAQVTQTVYDIFKIRNFKKKIELKNSLELPGTENYHHSHNRLKGEQN